MSRVKKWVLSLRLSNELFANLALFLGCQLNYERVSKIDQELFLNSLTLDSELGLRPLLDDILLLWQAFEHFVRAWVWYTLVAFWSRPLSDLWSSLHINGTSYFFLLLHIISLFYSAFEGLFPSFGRFYRPVRIRFNKSVYLE